MLSLLRGVNVGGHHKIRMDALRELYESLGLEEVRTFIQSGNVLFRAGAPDAGQLAARLESALDRTFGFRPRVVLRTVGELREVVAQNPFAGREGLDPSRLAVIFLSGEPSPEARRRALAIEASPEELHISGRELWIYYPNGMARPRLVASALEKVLGIQGTGRNWNSVTKLLALAEELDARG